ncbi:MAG: type III pantothenate kinase [Rhizomicrobium sp.]
MLLAIDVGNTNIVFAVCDGMTVRHEWRVVTDRNRTADEYAVFLSPLLAFNALSFGDFDAAIISNVVPAAMFDLRQLCRRYFHCEPMVIGDPTVDPGIRINIDHPETMGADRIVNAVAAYERYTGAMIIIDFGTATNFDVVSADGCHEGGVIAPGLHLSAQALHEAAAMLPRVAVARTSHVIAKDTVPAMQSGLYWGYIGLMEGLVTRIKAEYAAPMTVIATGGLASLFHRQSQMIDYLDRDLTIRGLVLVYERNKSGLVK